MSTRTTRLSLGWSIFGLCVLTVVVVGGLSALLTYLKLSSGVGGRIEERLVRELQSAADEAAAGLDGTTLASIVRSGSSSSSEYLTAQRHLRAVQQRFGLETDVYTLHAEGARTRFGVSCKDTPLLGDDYVLREEMKPLFAGAAKGRTGVYRDAHGWWISAYAAVRDASGDVVGIVEADHDLSPYIAESRERAATAGALALALSLLFVSPIAFILSRRIVIPLRRLTVAAGRVSRGDVFDLELDDQAGGEVGQLASSFKRAIVAIRFYVGRVRELESGEAAQAAGDGTDPADQRSHETGAA